MNVNFGKRAAAHAAAWAACLALVGCLGGGGDNSVPVAPVMLTPLMAIPAEASTSILELYRYQGSVNSSPQADQDKAEPLDISTFMPPSSETAEPFDV